MTNRNIVTESEGVLGIILAGGSGTRMAPMTTSVSKQLLTLYDKPMIHYPLTTLIEGGIRTVIIISQKTNLTLYRQLYGDGEALGMKIFYAEQPEPKGLAEAFIIADQFARRNDRWVSTSPSHVMPGFNRICMILGDNIFHGDAACAGLYQALSIHEIAQESAFIFVTRVKDPQRYGVAEFEVDGDLWVKSIEEKPKNPKSNWAVTGLYVYPPDVVGIAKGLTPSARGELEITAVNNEYIKREVMRHVRLGPGDAWLDSGTPDSMLDASQYVHAIQARQGRMVGCPEEAAFRNGWINRDDLQAQSKGFPNAYGDYLLSLSRSDD